MSIRSEDFWTDRLAFWARVGHGPDCWHWLAGKSDGYGVVNFDGRDQKAHRVAWQLSRGPIPQGMVVCHSCDNPPCCNPDHLFLGTIADNNRDRADKGRSKGTFSSGPSHPAAIRAGEKHWCAKISAADVIAIRLARDSGEGVQSIATRFHVHHSTISRIARRQWRKEVA